MGTALTNTKRWLLLALVLVIAAGSYYYVFDRKLYLGGDNVMYHLLSTALVQGDGYVNISHPAQPPVTSYPPGYPFIVVGIHTLHEGIIPVKLANGLFFLASLAVLFFLFRRFKVGAPFAALACLAVALNAYLLRYATIMMSEMAFLFLSVAALYCITRINTETPFYRERWLFAGLGAISAAYYVRSIGLALIFGVFVYFMLRRRWGYTGATAGGFVLLTLPWHIYLWQHGGSAYLNGFLQVNPYRPELGMAGIADLLRRISTNLTRYITIEIPQGIFPILNDYVGNIPAIGWIAGPVFAIFIIYGLYRLPAYRLLVSGYLAGTFGILLIWPTVWLNVRFIIPVIPFLIFLLFWGVRELFFSIRGSQQQNPLYLAGGYVLVVIALFLLSIGSLRRSHQYAEGSYPDNWQNFFQLAVSAKDHIPEKAVVSTCKPGFFYYFSGRPSVRFAYSENPQKVIEDLKKQGVNYVVVDQLGFSTTQRYLVPAIHTYRERFRVVGRVKNPNTYLLKFESDTLAFNMSEK